MAITTRGYTGEPSRPSYTINPIRDLNIIQYNCGNANNLRARPFLDSLNPKEYPVIALQEPITTEGNPYFTYCPRNYRPSREIKFRIKVIFLIYKRILLTKWKVIKVIDFIKYL